MSSPSSSIDYAASFGIHSVAAAAIFAVLFFPLGIWFIRQSIKNTTYVYIILALFCQMRVTAFIIRAIMANSTSAGSNLNLFIADQVLFGVGFLPFYVLAGGQRGSLFSFNPLRNPHAFRMALMAAVAIGIVATIDSTSSNSSDVSTGHSLRKVSTILFLALTLVQVGQSLWFLKDTTGCEFFCSSPGRSAEMDEAKSCTRPWGDRFGRYLICLISLLMLVRELFLTATINDAAKQNNERLWYPLVALPELLAVVCYSVSGLVPTRAALKAVNNNSAYSMRGDEGRPGYRAQS
ncbi:hypothetical protein B0H14DRAFT_3088891 [Mycena olivaceomarginata]|nr:hypothetical protein B0H14DRAFT_3088891 [Mycena olivaceomarginata]